MPTSAKSFLSIGKLLVALNVVAFTPASAQLVTSPISFTGGNANLIYDENQTNGTSDSSAPVIGLGNYAYAANLTETTGSLPSDLIVATAEGNSYQTGPLSANSGARLDLGSVTLTLNTAATYSNIGFLASAADGTGTVNYTLNFQDGSSVSSSFSVPDWFSSSTPATTNYSGGFTVVGTGSASVPGSPLDNGGQFLNKLYMYDFTTGSLSTSSALTSITLSKAGGGEIGIFGVSGELAVVPEPSTNALLVLGGASLMVFSLRRRNAGLSGSR